MNKESIHQSMIMIMHAIHAWGISHYHNLHWQFC